MSKHRRFKNPTIVEALCEIHFKESPQNPWKPSWFGEFFDKVKADYSELEPVQTIEFDAAIGPGLIGQAMRGKGVRMRYHRPDKKALLQLSKGLFTINILSPYPHWENFKAMIMPAWENCCLIVKPEEITRIGLRYINRLEQPKAGFDLKDYLKESPYLPQKLRIAEFPFLFRFEYSADQKSRLNITIADAEPAETTMRAIVLDLDAIVFTTLAIAKSPLEKSLDMLHDTVWQAFASMIGPKLEKLLEPMEE